MKIHYFVLSVLMLCAVSCSDRAVSDRLGEVERIIQEQPDSALLLIRAVDTASLSTKSLKARYSLLMAMALDKNYIDTTDVYPCPICYNEGFAQMTGRQVCWICRHS